MEGLKISINDKNEVEKFILISIIGLMDSLKEGIITIDESEKFLFSPYSVKKLNGLEISDEIISLIEEGCELEDIESLVPGKLSSAINNIKNKAISILSKTQSEKVEYKKWID